MQNGNQMIVVNDLQSLTIAMVKIYEQNGLGKHSKV